MISSNCFKILLAMIILPTSLFAKEEYTCSYPGYLTGDPIIMKVSVNANGDAFVGAYKYEVAKNNATGLVLIRSFAEFNKSTKSQDLGAFVFGINKKTLEMFRGNVVEGEAHDSYSTGRCIKAPIKPN